MALGAAQRHAGCILWWGCQRPPTWHQSGWPSSWVSLLVRRGPTGGRQHLLSSMCVRLWHRREPGRETFTDSNMGRAACRFWRWTSPLWSHRTPGHPARWVRSALFDREGAEGKWPAQVYAASDSPERQVQAGSQHPLPPSDSVGDMVPASSKVGQGLQLGREHLGPSGPLLLGLASN